MSQDLEDLMYDLNRLLQTIEFTVDCNVYSYLPLLPQFRFDKILDVR